MSVKFSYATCTDDECPAKFIYHEFEVEGTLCMLTCQSNLHHSFLHSSEQSMCPSKMLIFINSQQHLKHHCQNVIRENNLIDVQTKENESLKRLTL